MRGLMFLAFALVAMGGRAHDPVFPLRNLPSTDLGGGTVGFRSFGKDHGLSGGTINAMARDAEGFLWVGTEEDGIYRLEGERWRKMALQDRFRGVTVDGLVPAWPRGLWVITRQAVYLLDGWTCHSLPKAPGVPPGSWPSGVPMRNQGLVLYNPEKGRMALQVEGLGWREMALPPETKGIGYATATPDLRKIVIARAQGIMVCEEGLWKPLPGKLEALVRDLMIDASGDLWVRTLDGLFRSRGCRLPLERIPVQIPLSAGQSCMLVQAGDGRIWTNTADGLFWLHEGRQGFVGRGDGLPRGASITLALDAEGQVWTAGTGVHRLLGGLQWENWGRDRGLPSEDVWAIHRTPDSRLWVATGQGVAVMKGDHLASVPGFGPDTVSGMAVDREGRVWACRAVDRPGKSPLMACEPGAMVMQVPVVQGLPKGDAIDMTLGPEGSLWVLFPGAGLHRIQPAGKGAWRAQRHMPPDWKAGELHHVRTTSDGAVWMATSRGVEHWKEGRWSLLTGKAGAFQGLPFVFAGRPDGTLWVAFRDERGLIRLKAGAGGLEVVERISPTHPVGATPIFSMAVDDRDRLLLGTTEGLKVWDGKLTILHNAGDGWSSEDCCQNALRVEPGGRVWVGTAAGLVHGQLGRGTVVGPVKLHILGLADGKGRWFNSPEGQLVVPWASRSVVMHFAPRSLPPGTSNRYLIRLLGLEEAWRETHALDAAFPSLWPGRYTLEVAHLDPAGSMGPIAQFTFQVRAPWWLRIWALGLWGVAGGLGLAGIFRWRTAWLKRRNAQLEALILDRTRELEEANGALKEASLRDPLTGLFNRRYVSEVVPIELDRALRSMRNRLRQGRMEGRSNEDVVILLVDLDLFKHINDQHGHAAGDTVLREAARRLKGCFRATDVVARWGGEEFLVVVAHTDRSHAEPAAAQVVKTLAEAPVILEDGTSLDITGSVGFVSAPILSQRPDAFGLDTYLALADLCLYAAKRTGRNGYVGVDAFESPDSEAVEARAVSDLPGLVAEGRVTVLSSQVAPFG